MKKLIYFSILISGIHINLFASGGFCKKCEKIREYHRTHPSKYTYYEDYLRDKQEDDDEEGDDEKDFILPEETESKSKKE